MLFLYWKEEIKMQEIMTAKQLADYLQLNEMTIYKKAKSGEIPAVRLGKALRFKKDLIDKWLTIKSGWDYAFENLILETQAFGRAKKITPLKIQRAINRVRKAK